MKDFQAEARTLFDADTMSKLAGILRMSAPSAVDAFGKELIDICAEYRAIIDTLPCDLPDAPFNLSLTKRIEWLEVNVIKPCERLLGAIADDKTPMFSSWPYPLGVPKFPDRSTLRHELTSLAGEAKDLHTGLCNQQADDAGHSQELRAEIFGSLARLIRKHCPEQTPNRGVYDKELRRRVGPYVDAMRMMFGKIIGIEENLDRLIRQEISYPS